MKARWLAVASCAALVGCSGGAPAMRAAVAASLIGAEEFPISSVGSAVINFELPGALCPASTLKLAVGQDLYIYAVGPHGRWAAMRVTPPAYVWHGRIAEDGVTPVVERAAPFNPRLHRNEPCGGASEGDA